MLLTKLHIPEAGPGLVHRSNLFQQLDQGMKRKLILVSAPAGFGKTTVICDWIRQQALPATWFSIDDNDNDLVDFINYIIAGIKTLHPDFGSGALELLKSPTLPSFKSVINLLINDLTLIKDEFLLVLDDFHLITNIEILNAVSYLIDYQPKVLHLVLISRSDPGLPLAKLRSQQQLIELRGKDLSFKAADIANLFNRNLKNKLSERDIKLLENKTEGWIAGLQLAAISMKGQSSSSDFIHDLAGNNRYIMDYLMEEVLRVQSDEIKIFLLKISLLDQFSASLCNYVLGISNAQTILEELERVNAFVIPLDSERKWYRFHHLFGDLLKQRCHDEFEPEINDLHIMASRWFELNNMRSFAVRHALAVKDYQRSIGLIEPDIEQMWKNGSHGAIIKYGNQIPHTVIQESPVFSLYYSWILASSGKSELALNLLSHSEESAIRNTDNSNSHFDGKLSGRIAVALAFLYSQDNNYHKTMSYFDIAMENLPSGDILWHSWAWFSKGTAYYNAIQLNESIEAYEKALNYGKESGNVYVISSIAIRIAESEQQLGRYKKAYQRCVDLLDFVKQKGFANITTEEWIYAPLYFIIGVSRFSWAEFEEAFENIKKAYKLCERANDIFLRISTLMVYSFVLKELGDPDHKNKFAELDDLFSTGEMPVPMRFGYIGLKIYMSMEDENYEQAEKLIIDHVKDPINEIDITNEGLYISYARLLTAKNEIGKAEQIINKLYPVVTAEGRIERKIELKILNVQLKQKQGKQKEAVKELMEAMEIAHVEGLISYFIFNYAYIKDSLEEVFKIQATSKTPLSSEYINKLKAALEKRSRLKSSQKESYDLSVREVDTLKLITKGFSNQEIADELFVSQNTVKTHLKNIFIKLGVNSRKEAAEKARELSIK